MESEGIYSGNLVIIGASVSEAHTNEFNSNFSYIICHMSFCRFLMQQSNTIAVGCTQTISHTTWQPASSKKSLKEDANERQPGRTAGACTPIGSSWV